MDVHVAPGSRPALAGLCEWPQGAHPLGAVDWRRL